MYCKSYLSILFLLVLALFSCERVDWDDIKDDGKEVVIDADSLHNSSDNENSHLGASSGKGSYGEPFSASEIRTLIIPDSTQCWVSGVIVGFTKNNSMKNTVFGVQNSVESNIIIADSITEREIGYCVPVELSKTAIKRALSLKDNPSGYGRRIKIFGIVLNYYKVKGIRSVSHFEWIKQQ